MNLLLMQTANAPAQAPGLNAGGVAFMLISVGFVVGLVAWCFYKVLTVPDPEREAVPPAGLGP
ncbi:MAG TPA: hypothetical protein VEI02_10940 [Planctomycetota bacterium]|nr:hypothetical protein [Planctomycetota bacterium]